MMLSPDHPLVMALVGAIHAGDVPLLQEMLRDNPTLATARIGAMDPQCGKQVSRSLLHIATDWPGNYPNAAATVRALIDAGADVNARFEGAHQETPLHWAASSDDVAVLDALLDAGADIEADGAVIGGGTPLADAVAFGQWKAARRLVERGAVANLWQAAALGIMDRLHELVEQGSPTPDQFTEVFWLACHGGSREAAEYLLALGADINWVGYDQLTPLGAAKRENAQELVAWLESLGAR